MKIPFKDAQSLQNAREMKYNENLIYDTLNPKRFVLRRYEFLLNTNPAKIGSKDFNFAETDRDSVI